MKQEYTSMFRLKHNVCKIFFNFYAEIFFINIYINEVCAWVVDSIL